MYTHCERVLFIWLDFQLISVVFVVNRKNTKLLLTLIELYNLAKN